MTAQLLSGASLVVTGGTGFLGSAFVRRAIQDGADVTVVARTTSSHWRLASVVDRYSVLISSLAHLDHVPPPERARGGAMVHFAAAGVNQSFDDVGEMVGTNVGGTAQALAFAVRAGVSRFVLVGSSGEYGPGEDLAEDARLDPTSEYGATRAAATLLARAFAVRRGLDVVVVRPFAAYGPFEAPYRLVPYAIVHGLRGEPIQVSAGTQTRDYVHVDDVADGICRACVVREAGNGVFNLCTGVQTNVADAARLVAHLTDAGAIVETGARPAIPGEMWRTSGNPAAARLRLSWSARFDLSRGLAHTIDWFRTEGCNLAAYRMPAP